MSKGIFFYENSRRIKRSIEQTKISKVTNEDLIRACSNIISTIVKPELERLKKFL